MTPFLYQITDMECELSYVTPATHYEFRVSAGNMVGVGEPSESLVVETPQGKMGLTPRGGPCIPG